MSTRREIETSEYLSFVRRALRAAGERVADCDPFDLAELLTIRESVEVAITTAVVGLRSQGYSWAEVGDGLGISRQAAQQRYGKAEAA
ncbi:hypothetical protein [Streptomyces sp. AC495_CC817]|uniref:hypothetical protein n=1 Tax=Streptomyces sp. AC495_CC817 TaxID=2823900 RepID=UPI001C269FAC|nr:hypothetical protein [Streptomyces sp. AC495_CC817]